MKLFDLFTEDDFRAAAAANLITRREHPTEPLYIYNYTPLCQYERAWNDVTRQCRGLIATHDNEVVARPFRKFFNHGEPSAPTLELDAPVKVTDKLDGSLGILYPTSSGFAIATRGSFESDQALEATRMLQPYLDDGWEPVKDFTYLFEILYPENRIVVDYKGVRDLFLLATLETQTGVEWVIDDWKGPRVGVFPYRTFADALAAEPRPNAEGLVVSTNGDRVKIKQDDYVELHRIVTGLSAKVIWEAIGAGKKVREIKEPLPEEFHQWVDDVAAGMLLRRNGIKIVALDTYHEIINELLDEHPRGWTRKDFALKAKEHPEFTPYLFQLLDKKDIDAAIWKTLKPVGSVTPRDFEAVA